MGGFGNINPISVLSTTEMLEGFDVQIKMQQHIVDIGGGLSTFGSIVQQKKAFYTSIDDVYQHSRIQLTRALLKTINPLIEKHWGKGERMEALELKVQELVHVLSAHPFMNRDFFGIDLQTVQRRSEDIDQYIERWFGDTKHLIEDTDAYFSFFVHQYYGSKQQDLRSKKQLYQLLDKLKLSGSIKSFLGKFLGQKIHDLYHAYISSEESRKELVEIAERLRRIDAYFYRQLVEILQAPPIHSRSNTKFIPLSLQQSDPTILEHADLVFCNFVLNGLSEVQKKSLINHVSMHIVTDAVMHVSVPEEDQTTTQALISQGGYIRNGITYWKGGKNEVGELDHIFIS